MRKFWYVVRERYFFNFQVSRPISKVVTYSTSKAFFNFRFHVQTPIMKISLYVENALSTEQTGTDLFTYDLFTYDLFTYAASRMFL